MNLYKLLFAALIFFSLFACKKENMTPTVPGTANPELGIENVIPSSLGSSYTTNFNRYTKVTTSNGGAIHIVAQNLITDEYFTSPTFTELGFKSSYTFNIERLKTNIEVFTGAKNLFNAYQTSFDIGKERDSNFIYGPATPRTFFIGLKFGN